MEYKHFSHPHNLRLYHQLHQDDSYTCSGCESIISGSAYSCWQCKFFLHEHCGNARRAIQHNSHPMHHLTLVPFTTYSVGSFLCNACGDTGVSFSFCCPLCDFDLHVHCASLPECITHSAHFHSLSLCYGLPHPNNYGGTFYCDVCHKLLDQKFWSYNCFACNFHVHTSCVSEVKGVEVVDNVAGGATAKPELQVEAQKEDGSASVSTQSHLSEQTEREDPVLSAQCELLRLQLQMQMTQELAKMMASFNLSSLV